MKNNSKTLLISLFFLIFSIILSSYVWATVDIPAINKYTGEYFIFEDPDYIGIGWEIYGEGKWDEFEKIINEKEYKLTKNPYKVEILLTFFTVLITISLITKKIFKSKP